MSKITLLETETPQPPAPGKVSLFIGEDGELYKIDSSDKLTRINQQVWKAGYKLEFMGRTYGVVQSLTGRLWLDRNLGASQVATAHDNADAFGDLYQWGRGADGHQLRQSATTATLAANNNAGHGNFITIATSPYDWRSSQNNNLWQAGTRINLPAPIGWRLPTEAEWLEEMNSWSELNRVGAFNSPLKLAAGGSRLYSTGNIINVGSTCAYWSCTVDGYRSKAIDLSLGSGYTLSGYRANAYAVRLIKDE